MRLLLKLSAIGNKLTFNYNYPLAAVIYNFLRIGSDEFSDFLHEKGYRIEGKSYKLFNFALRPQNAIAQRDKYLLRVPNAELIISSPISEEFIQNFVIGTFNNHTFSIEDGNIRTNFRINSVEVIPEPIFTDKMRFTLLSPIVLSTKRETNGKLKQYYFRFYDDIDEINRVLTKNLTNKFRLIYNKEINGVVRIKWDETYIEKKNSEGKRLTKKVTIHANDQEATDVIGNLLPFEITAPPELIRTGWECGFGEKNSMGFGMASPC
ncbi:MAG: CRISPR-associated endoribonuclease Cas6 [Ignavibacteria bacterium]|jgi:CRISPR-associated endoribonuclease Cas6|nr:CRISPR-associated endoribonuclease Cas6 [Ignavibacteria bacterium]MCU7504472.1 CRISPR-associated endoribonuclease Cas6 [Ignavibacteria bacterium]MCU7517949.1 CRISPR-associated endoribonuclease Cas6 [Ignavibacteria bacterium]